MIHPDYQLTDPRTNLRPARVDGSEPKAIVPTVGAYNHGLFTIVDESVSNRLLVNWSWLVGSEAIALMTTGFGDVFFWKPKEGVHFLGVQRAEVEFVDAEFRWFFEEFLVKPQVVDTVLRKPLFDRLVRLHRPLQYGETFILEPWLILGGKENAENYAIGGCSVYLDLVCQTHRHNR